MGHLHIPHDRTRDPFPGICPYHGDCLEGLASGPAMQARWNQPGSTLRPEHPGWDLEAHYLALGLMNLAVAFSPQRIIMGGGVMQQEHMVEKLRAEFKKIMNGYIRHPDVSDRLDLFIQAPALGTRSGVLGALVLAERIHSDTLIEQRMNHPETEA
jgi:fructokinase